MYLLALCKRGVAGSVFVPAAPVPTPPSGNLPGGWDAVRGESIHVAAAALVGVLARGANWQCPARMPPA